MQCATIRPRAFGAHAPRRAVCAAPVAAMKLYTNPASRGRINEWYMQEIGVSAEMVNLDMKEKKEHKAPSFLEINPFGKVPALEDGDLKLFESGAILLYLADKYGPAKSPEARATANKWILFANSTMANSIFLEQFREKQMPPMMDVLESILSKRDYLEGEFTVADVAVGAYLLYVPAFFPQLDLSPWPHVVKYMQRLAARPACAATVAARVQQATSEAKK